MEPFVFSQYILRDMRTNTFFGGGVASELFVHWVDSWTDAKMFKDPEDIRPVLQQLIDRTKKYANDPAVSKTIIEKIPPYAPGVYMIHKVLVRKDVEQDGLIVR